MTNEPESPWREILPKANYFEKAIDLIASFDNLMVTLYSAMIAGIVVLLLKEEVSLWVGGALVLALVCFALGIGHTLLHISFTTKVLLLAEALANGTELVPNIVEEEEPTVQAFARNQAWAQRSFISQLIYLIVGIGFAALAVILRLWEYAWRAGVIGLAAIAALFAAIGFFITWKKVLRRFPPSLTANSGNRRTQV